MTRQHSIQITDFCAFKVARIYEFINRKVDHLLNKVLQDTVKPLDIELQKALNEAKSKRNDLDKRTNQTLDFLTNITNMTNEIQHQATIEQLQEAKIKLSEKK